jgi:phage I-like protein
MPKADIFTLANATPLTGEGGVPDELVYMPEGTHTIHCRVNWEPVTKTITIGPEVLAPLQASLEKRLKKNVRPFGGFDHQEGKASFIPKAFRYEAGRGLILAVEWTRAGREAIEGKDYSYFSPSFITAKGKTAPIGLPDYGEIGSLVNEPAFEAIERIAASHQDSELMEKLEQLQAALVAAKIVTEEQSKDLPKLVECISANFEEVKKSEIASAVAEATKDAPEKSELEKELGALKEKLATTEGNLKTATEALAAKRTAEAEDAIAEAVKAGRIPAQDEDTKTYWRDQLTNEATADRAKKEIAKLAGAEALKAGRHVDPGKGGDELKGLDRAIAAHKAASKN